MHKLGRVLRICVLAGVIVVPAVALAAPPGPKSVYAITCLQERYEPKQITIACVDGTVKVTKLKWTSWSSTKARASGIYQVDRCNPSCASGHTRSFPVKVTLSRPKTCLGHKHRAFGRLSYAFGAKRPNPTPGHTSLPCPTGPLPPGY
ncbi:MAG TPA: hypothetical protein VH279_07480 [Solirubrobacteraceae bacterium]|jgi:hypothetical protein|nr:hypothetical protein [Solirubrobacteraceae bacterium]